MYYVYVSLYVYVCVYMRTRRYTYMRRGIIPVDRAKVPAHAHLTISCVIAKSYRRSRKVCISTMILTSTCCQTRHVRGAFLIGAEFPRWKREKYERGEDSSSDRGKSFLLILFLSELITLVTMP